ncbi:MAG: hypothetical protein GEV28_34495 [Actinophytocola sp.]|uniref:hypothetical protein n=1 Tax=Actinophytocola sp. TaxID=1872138 RepID=UPI00132453CE|nr:hypothetical protein [Actinophytocola sp.]MPZ85225.1 hypothetical protein [Actinophytocola sp.]
MTTKRVLDAAGREWTVEQRFAPWRRVVQPIGLATRRYRRRTLRLAPPPARPSRRPTPRMTRGDKAAAVAVAPLVAYDLLLQVVVLGVVAVVVLLPLVVIEAAAQVVAGTVLAALRTTGLVRRRVDVTVSTAHYLHSETVLLVRGPVRELMADLATERRNAKASFRPAGLPDRVEVRSHRSIWQSSDEWR